jgi:hypothetical protein
VVHGELVLAGEAEAAGVGQSLLIEVLYNCRFL